MLCQNTDCQLPPRIFILKVIVNTSSGLSSSHNLTKQFKKKVSYIDSLLSLPGCMYVLFFHFHVRPNASLTVSLDMSFMYLQKSNQRCILMSFVQGTQISKHKQLSTDPLSRKRQKSCRQIWSLMSSLLIVPLFFFCTDTIADIS